MRRLLIRLIALETALVGWLAYWLFLVYASNPSVSEGLASQLSRFPQLSFTTVDLTVLVIIGVLSLFLAFKFQRGLKPGIRLERALQMLENLMKRNLILESQVAEMKLEKTQVVTTPQTGTTGSESRAVSWEKAFRTPLEAGPIPSAQNTHPSGFASEKEPEFQTPIPRAPPPRIEPKAAIQAGGLRQSQARSDKHLEKAIPVPERSSANSSTLGASPISQSAWEDSPKFLRETSGILTSSPPPSKPIPLASELNPPRQPYIPAPVPKIVPPSVILGPGVTPVSSAKPPTRPPTARFVANPQSSQKLGYPAATSQPKVTESMGQQAAPTPSGTEMTRPSPPEKKDTEPTVTSSAPAKGSVENPVKSGGKTPSTKKRFPWEDE